MTEIENIEKSLADQLADLVQRNPQNYDVTFSVGPDKVKVKAVKIILKAASPVFEREFENKWESAAVVEEGDGIPLLDVNPDVFKLFVNLIISDTWSKDALSDLNLDPSTVLDLLRVCRRFEITKAIKNLEKQAGDFIQNFNYFQDSIEFLNVSQENLETTFSCEEIPLKEIEIFESACRWAGHQCKKKEIEPTGENYREVLGGCLFQIRFPAMTCEDFTTVSVLKNGLFTANEKLAVYEYIGTKEDNRSKYDTSILPFRTGSRIICDSLKYSVLRVPRPCKVIANSPFVCNGNEVCNYWFQVSQKIALRGIGFLGPIDEDTQFNTTAKIVTKFNGSYTYNSGKLTKSIFARKGRIFYLLFDKPISIEPIASDSSWTNFHHIEYSLKGTNNVSRYKAENPKEKSVQISGVEFNLNFLSNNNKPLAELLFNIK